MDPGAVAFLFCSFALVLAISFMGYFIHPEAGNDRSILDEKMLLAAIRFYVEVFKGRSLVSNDEMTAELCARTLSLCRGYSTKENAPEFDYSAFHGL